MGARAGGLSGPGRQRTAIGAVCPIRPSGRRDSLFLDSLFRSGGGTRRHWGPVPDGFRARVRGDRPCCCRTAGYGRRLLATSGCRPSRADPAAPTRPGESPPGMAPFGTDPAALSGHGRHPDISGRGRESAADPGTEATHTPRARRSTDTPHGRVRAYPRRRSGASTRGLPPTRAGENGPARRGAGPPRYVSRPSAWSGERRLPAFRRTRVPPSRLWAALSPGSCTCSYRPCSCSDAEATTARSCPARRPVLHHPRRGRCLGERDFRWQLSATARRRDGSILHGDRVGGGASVVGPAMNCR